jgi:hypothetical protein
MLVSDFFLRETLLTLALRLDFSPLLSTITGFSAEHFIGFLLTLEAESMGFVMTSIFHFFSCV